MRPLSGMAYSDSIVHTVLTQLINQYGEDTVITQEMISEASGVPLRTCQRALKRLLEAGLIEGEFQYRVGYKYRICNGSSTRTRTTGIPSPA